MYKGNRIAVVVPAYNEEGFVGTVIDTMPEFVDRAYVIDDRSTDGTWEEIREAAAAANQRSEQVRLADGGETVDRWVVPIRHERNQGVGAAIKTGYRRALADGMDVVAVMNGDGQMDPALLDRLLDPVVAGDADYAKGNRLHSREYRAGMSGWRWFGNVSLTWLTRVASGYWQLLDSQNGYTAISARALDRIDLDDLYDDYGFLNDLLVRLNVSEVRVAHVAMPAVYGDEQSDIAYASFIPRISLLLAHRFLWRLRTEHRTFDLDPMPICYSVGTLGAALGAITLPLALLSLVSPASSAVDWGLFSPLLLLAGTLSFVLGMDVDSRENRGLEMQVHE